MCDDDYDERSFFDLSVGGRSYRVPDSCPHRGGRLRHGTINAQRRTITCPLHGSTFSLETGEQLGGPPCGRLAVEPREPTKDGRSQDS
jgi:nitrite reductase/ring-hydroxylating ferredoxin subunit